MFKTQQNLGVCVCVCVCFNCHKLGPLAVHRIDSAVKFKTSMKEKSLALSFCLKTDRVVSLDAVALHGLFKARRRFCRKEQRLSS